MSDPISPPGAPQPFASAPIEPRAGGCGKPVFVGCGVVLVLLGIAGVIFVVKAKDLLVWSLEKAKGGITANLPPDVTAADRERFETAFAAAAGNIKAGKMDPAALQRLQRRLMETVQKPQGQVTREEFLDLTRAFEELGGLAPPAVAEPAAPPPLAQPAPPPP
jgi:hypothetical protein